ncbi:MAG: DUF2339 domain-containing protein [Candidatus Methylacidiphilales bacterium]
MDDKDRQELAQLLKEQRTLEDRMKELSSRLEALVHRVEAPLQPVQPQKTHRLPPPPPQPISLQELPGQPAQQLPAPVFPPEPASVEIPAMTAAKTDLGSNPVSPPAPAPAPAPASPAPPPLLAKDKTAPPAYKPLLPTPAQRSSEPPPPAQQAPPKRSVESAGTDDAQSWETALVSWWLPRVGALLLVITLGTFVTYLYYNFIEYIGPVMKFGALLTAGVALAGFGAWVERREGYRDYGGVVLATGLAVIYFTLYAGHHVDQLRVIPSLLADVILLIAWASGVMALAQWRQNQWLALMAVVLGFLPLTMSPVNPASLSANFILAVAAVVMMLRNRWAYLSYASMACTYAAFMFWRLPGMDADLSAPPPFIMEAGFLLAYWCVYTAVVFLSRAPEFDVSARTAFLTFNNVSLVFLYLTRFQDSPSTLSLVVLVMGLALGGLYVVARYLVVLPEMVCNAYLAQSLLLSTAGITGYFSGLARSALLLVSSTMLLVYGKGAASVVARAFGRIIAGVAFIFIFWHVASKDPGSILLGLTAAAVWIFNARWSRAMEAPAVHAEAPAESSDSPASEVAAPTKTTQPRPITSGFGWLHSLYFCCLAVLVVWAMVVAQLGEPYPIDTGLVIAILALVGVLAAPVLRVPELAVGSYLFLLSSQFHVCVMASEHQTRQSSHPVWFGMKSHLIELGVVVIITLATSLWWSWAQRTAQGTAAKPGPGNSPADSDVSSQNGPSELRIFSPAGMYIPLVPPFLNVACALGVVFTILGVMRHEFYPYNLDEWIGLNAALAVVFFAYSLFYGEWILAGVVQIFLAVSIYHVLLPAFPGGDAGRISLPWVAVPFIAILGMVNWLEILCRQRRIHETTGYNALNLLMWAYTVMGLLLWAVVIPIHAIPELHLLLYAGSALIVMMCSIAMAGDSRPWLTLPLVVAGIIVWLFSAEIYGDGLNLLGVLHILGMDLLARVFDPQYARNRPWHIAGILLGLAALVLATSSAVVHVLNGYGYITLNWAGLAVVIFMIGLILNERVYRLSGLVLLLLALTRVCVYDVWQFATIFKILSLLMISLACLALPPAYVWWGKRMRQWL